MLHIYVWWSVRGLSVRQNQGDKITCFTVCQKQLTTDSYCSCPIPLVVTTVYIKSSLAGHRRIYENKWMRGQECLHTYRCTQIYGVSLFDLSAQPSVCPSSPSPPSFPIHMYTHTHTHRHARIDVLLYVWIDKCFHLNP